jgi:hypothetical protein
MEITELARNKGEIHLRKTLLMSATFEDSEHKRGPYCSNI